MLNVAVIMGRLVADPELRHTSGDLAVTSFTVAVDRTSGRSGADRQTSFIDVVAWRNQAEFVCKYFHKGQMIVVQGYIQTRSYTDREGVKRKAFEIVANNVEFGEPKRDSYGTPPEPTDYSSSQPSYQNSRPAAAIDQPAPAYTSGDTGDFEEIPTDDDLPF